MSPLCVSVLCSLLVVVYGHVLLDVCPEEDSSLCTHVLDRSTRRACYLRDVAAVCCRKCHSLAATDMPKNGLFGDQSDGVTSNGKLYTWDVVVQDTCKYCNSPHHGRDHCCETCNKVCGSQSQDQSPDKRLNNILRALRNLVEKYGPLQ